MWHPVLMISGYILSVLGVIMLIPACLDLTAEDAEWSHFITGAMITVFTGAGLFLANRTKIERISLKQGYLLTAISWFLTIIFASLPFILTKTVPSVYDAIFEASSGITGTGATIMSDVESLPQSVLLWRSILNALGGLGIVIFAVALLPFLGIGGMQMFQRENSDSSDKFMPKFSYIAKRIVFVYCLLLGIACGTLFLCGMSWFDALNHAMSAIGTGGFSTKNNSIAFYDSAKIEFAVMIFMLAGSLPMTFYILLFRRGNADKYNQISVFLKTVLYSSLFVGGYLFLNSDYGLLNSLRYAFFNVIATVTTTGLAATDYTDWGVWATSVFLLLSFCGGCTGSTCGSIKIFRWQTIYAFLKKYILSAIEPHRIVHLKIGNINASEKIMTSVFVYVFSFIVCLVALSLTVSLFGVNFQTAIASVTACITNVGSGSISIIGPSGNYAFFAPAVKCILAFAMLLGRLEIITVMVLLSRSFWKK